MILFFLYISFGLVLLSNSKCLVSILMLSGLHKVFGLGWCGLHFNTIRIQPVLHLLFLSISLSQRRRSRTAPNGTLPHPRRWTRGTSTMFCRASPFTFPAQYTPTTPCTHGSTETRAARVFRCSPPACISSRSWPRRATAATSASPQKKTTPRWWNNTNWSSER